MDGSAWALAGVCAAAAVAARMLRARQRLPASSAAESEWLSSVQARLAAVLDLQERELRRADAGTPIPFATLEGHHDEILVRVTITPARDALGRATVEASAEVSWPTTAGDAALGPALMPAELVAPLAYLSGLDGPLATRVGRQWLRDRARPLEGRDHREPDARADAFELIPPELSMPVVTAPGGRTALRFETSPQGPLDRAVARLVHHLRLATFAGTRLAADPLGALARRVVDTRATRPGDRALAAAVLGKLHGHGHAEGTAAAEALEAAASDDPDPAVRWAACQGIGRRARRGWQEAIALLEDAAAGRLHPRGGPTSAQIASEVAAWMGATPRPEATEALARAVAHPTLLDAPAWQTALEAIAAHAPERAFTLADEAIRMDVDRWTRVLPALGAVDAARAEARVLGWLADADAERHAQALSRHPDAWARLSRWLGAWGSSAAMETLTSWEAVAPPARVRRAASEARASLRARLEAAGGGPGGLALVADAGAGDGWLSQAVESGSVSPPAASEAARG